MEEIKSSNHVWEPASDGQCDSPGHNFTYSTVSAIDNTIKKLINFSVFHTNVWYCLNRTIKYY